MNRKVTRKSSKPIQPINRPMKKAELDKIVGGARTKQTA